MARHKKAPVPRKLTYEERQKQLQIKEERVQEALIEIRDKRATIHAAAKAQKVSRGVIISRLAGRKPLAESNANKRKLNEAEEEVLSGYILYKEAQHKAIRLSQLEHKANAIISRKKDDHATPSDLVGKKWPKRFIKRRTELHAFKEKGTSNSKAFALTPERWNQYFDLLELAIQEGNHNASTIYGMDETSVWLDKSTRSVKLVGSKANGKTKRPIQGADNDYRESATAIECIRADGTMIPTFFILRGTREKMVSIKTLNHNSPKDSVYWQNPSAYNNTLVMHEWVNHLIKHSKVGSEETPRILLLMDNVKFHIVDEVKGHFSQNCIDILTYPPNCTDELQGLDKECFLKLKEVYDATSRDRRGYWWQNNRKNMPARWAMAREEAWTPELIKRAFRTSGAWPPNCHAINKDRIHDVVQIESLSQVPLQNPPTDESSAIAKLEKLIADNAGTSMGPTEVTQAKTLMDKVKKQLVKSNASHALSESDIHGPDPLLGPNEVPRRQRKPRKPVESTYQRANGPSQPSAGSNHPEPEPSELDLRQIHALSDSGSEDKLEQLSDKENDPTFGPQDSQNDPFVSQFANEAIQRLIREHGAF